MRNLVFLLVLLIVAVVLRIDFLFVVFYLFALVYLLSSIWVQSITRKLEIERRFVDHAFCGDRVPVYLWVRNESWLPVPWIEIHESLGQGSSPVQLATPPFYRRVSSLRGHDRQRLEYELHPRRRGYYGVGPLALRTGDLFGLVRPRVKRCQPAHPLIVYPRIVPLQRLGLPTRSPQAILPARSPLFQDPSRVMGVRGYQRGDSPRRLHWTATAKASARAGSTRLMVKQYQPAIARETVICLDLYRENYGLRQRYAAAELAIVVAASLANHIVVQEGLPVGLVTNGTVPLGGGAFAPLPAEEGRGGEVSGGQVSGGTPADTLAFVDQPLEDLSEPDSQGSLLRFSLSPRAGRGHLMNLLEVLARVQIADRPSIEAEEPGTVQQTPPLSAGHLATFAGATFATLLRQEAQGLPWGATLSIITGTESEGLLATLLYLRRAGFAVTLILVQPGPDTTRPRTYSGQLKVPVYRVWQEGDLGALQ